MGHFFVKLVSPRPTFTTDLDERELATMQRHFAFWSELTTAGTALVFGPVFEDGSPYGMGIVEAGDEAAVRAIVERDPAVAERVMAGYSVTPMRVGGLRATPLA